MERMIKSEIVDGGIRTELHANGREALEMAQEIMQCVIEDMVESGVDPYDAYKILHGKLAQAAIEAAGVEPEEMEV